jgi:hypothetical protein
MTHDTHAVPGAAVQTVFSPAEVEAFRREDGSAGRTVVCLLVGIFTLGLVGYIGVCLWVHYT